MSKEPQDNANSINLALKRKRALVWPSSTRAQCEEILSSLTLEGILQELNPLTNGALTRAHLKERSSTSTSSWPSTTRAFGRGQRYVNTHTTPQGQPEQMVLRGDTSPPSIPVSSNYFDPLSEEVEEVMEEGTNPGLPAPNPLATQFMQQQQQNNIYNNKNRSDKYNIDNGSNNDNNNDNRGNNNTSNSHQIIHAAATLHGLMDELHQHPLDWRPPQQWPRQQ